MSQVPSKVGSENHILCLQETHGLPFEVFTELGSLLPGWRALHSACLDVHGISNGAAGGVAILICPNTANVCDFKHTALYLGRVHKVSFEFYVGQSVPPSDVPISPDRCSEVVNIHNYGFNRGNIVAISEEVARMKSRDFLARAIISRFSSEISIFSRITSCRLFVASPN